MSAGIVRRAGRLVVAAGMLPAVFACRDARQAGPAPASVLPSPAPAGSQPRRDILSTEHQEYSRGKEEVIIRDFFQDRRDGWFLDVGCHHPVNASNTYYLEQHLGWSGIGVDALPEMAPRWARRRPRSRFLNYIVTDHAGALEPFFVVRGHTDLSAMERPMRDPAGGRVDTEEIKVPTITLTKLLDDHRVTRIDFMSLDIEGAEPLALAGFDIERFRPQLVCVEAKVRNRAWLAQYFAAHGYEQLLGYLDHDQTNYYYTPKAARR